MVKAAAEARYPHFGPEPDRIYLTDEEGLFSLKLDGSDRRHELTVNAPRGNRRGDDPPRAEAIYIHPDGSQVLAFANKQVWSIARTRAGSRAPEVDLRPVGSFIGTLVVTMVTVYHRS